MSSTLDSCFFSSFYSLIGRSKRGSIRGLTVCGFTHHRISTLSRIARTPFSLSCIYSLFTMYIRIFPLTLKHIRELGSLSNVLTRLARSCAPSFCGKPTLYNQKPCRFFPPPRQTNNMEWDSRIITLTHVPAAHIFEDPRRQSSHFFLFRVFFFHHRFLQRQRNEIN